MTDEEMVATLINQAKKRERMKKYKALFQGDDVLLIINANNIKEARKIFNKQIMFKELKNE